MKFSEVTQVSVETVLEGRPLVWIAPNATAKAASILMNEENVGAVAVMDDGRLVGILSERDVVRRCVAKNGYAPYRMPVWKIMTPNPITVDRKVPLGMAAMLMIEKNIRHVPVTAGGKVLGVVSIRRVVEEFRRNFDGNLFDLAVSA